MEFSIETGLAGREALSVMNAAPKLGLKYVFRSEPLPGTIPIGSVAYCERILSSQFNQYPIDFYPGFLASETYRKIGYGVFGFVESNGDYSPIKRREIFLKPAKVWKGDFRSRVVRWNEEVPIDWYYWSEPVHFVNEWRYYIANGEVMDSGWYDGHNDQDAPKFPLERRDMPYGYCGAVDMGMLQSGKLALVEAHAPFACGWYGSNHENYLRWLQISWSAYSVNGGALFDDFRLKNMGRF